MGEQKVSMLVGKRQKQAFMVQLLKDVSALEHMLENDWFESGITRIGAEQEMVLVNKTTLKPSLRAMELIEKMSEFPWLETELAKFNLEINLDPQELTGKCFSNLKNEVSTKLNTIQTYADEMDIHILLTGILPTLRKDHLSLDNLTPKKRYRALMDAISDQLVGSSFELKLEGIDELTLKHDSPLLEACNTSFQVHLQVDPADFVKMYNFSLGVCGPCLAVAANSPIVFGRRLWHESRIAMFQQALDTRTAHDHLRERSPRVSFGRKWLENSILEIYKEDIARFRVLLSADIAEDSLKMIKNGQVPNLKALQVHNSTVYRWNRPCYGISPNGKPHLRIENRVFSSGPTVMDEVANSALWLGAMCGMKKNYEDIREFMSFEDTRDNFGKAAQFGLDTKFTWFKDKKISASDLAKEVLLPLAKEGLKEHNVHPDDISKYMDIIEGRLDRHQTGARWMLQTYSTLKQSVAEDEARVILTHHLLKNQLLDIPVHEWEKADISDSPEYKPNELTVEEMMQTDVLTVQADDMPEFVARMMEWNDGLRYVPVEDVKGTLIGLVSSRNLLKHFVDKHQGSSKKLTTVEDIMVSDPISIGPKESIITAGRKMRKNRIGCLPVVMNGELIGLLTEEDFLRLSNRLIDRLESS